jgi:hypothetical protein
VPETLLALLVTVGVPLKVVGGILGAPVVAELEDSRLRSDEFFLLLGRGAGRESLGEGEEIVGLRKVGNSDQIGIPRGLRAGT